MTTEFPSSPTSNLWQPNRQRSKQIELIVKIIFGAFALVSIATTIGIIETLIVETVKFFQEVSLWQFLTDDKWTPLFRSAKFGIFVLISATVMTSSIVMWMR